MLPQRQYTTTLGDYERLKEVILSYKNDVQIKTDPNPEKGDRGNFTFRLKGFENIGIQITSQRFYLKLHGVKPEQFLLDLNVIRKLTSILGELYPSGVDFGLDKETAKWRDQVEIIERQKEMLSLRARMHKMTLKKPASYASWMKRIWKEFETNPAAHNHLARVLNNCFASFICRNGFRCLPNGALEFNKTVENVSLYPLLQFYINTLQKSGFLQN